MPLIIKNKELEDNQMYKIIEKTSGYVIDIAKINVETRKELEEAGFICKKVGA